MQWAAVLGHALSFTAVGEESSQLRLECNDGQRVDVTFHDGFPESLGKEESSNISSASAGSTCNVLYADGVVEPLPAHYQHVLTASLPWAGWLGRRGHVHFLDALSWRSNDLEAALTQKTHLLSILFPATDLWDRLMEALHAEASALGQAVFIDDGRQTTYDTAFQASKYGWILEDRKDSIHPAFLTALGHYTIPIYSGWVLVTNMFHNSVLRLPLKRGAVAEAVWQLRLMDVNDEDMTMTNYHHTIMDVLLYRYRAPFMERLSTAACTLCSGSTEFIVVGIYSGRGNVGKRTAIRETWGRLLAQNGIRVIFFLGAAGPAPGKTEDTRQEDALADSEAETFGDVVRLPVPEGYRYNAQKGLAFLQYMASHYASTAFCIKVDDDVYWRPEGLLRMLRQRTPFRYIWGFLDLQSPVPRETDSAFFHSAQAWPDDIFPPYARGVLRVLSMDIVRQVAAAHKWLSMGVSGDDPSLGVHLRQLVMQERAFLQLDDRGAMSRFAMEPTCIREGSYCPLKDTTWIVHHVSGKAIKCMFRQDIKAGYYNWRTDGDLEVQVADSGLPSLCACVDHRQAYKGLRAGLRSWRMQCPRRRGDARA